MSTSDRWIEESEGWDAWAQTGDDGFSEFEGLIPAPARATLDLGCGEGRFARRLSATGHHVTGLDVSPALVARAREQDPGGEYLVGDAVALPFEDGAFDLVVAFNVLSCVGDLGRATGEIARVLPRGGRLCASIVHPLYTAGQREGEVWRVDDYFEERMHEERATRDGASLVFTNIHRPLEAYTYALEKAGLVVEQAREPRRQRVPMFLHLRALKP